MPSQFEKKPDDNVLLTPEVAELVVERFAEIQAERQQAEAAERERLASMTRVQELADVLGTTPEEIETIAKEVSGSRRRIPVVPKPSTSPEKSTRRSNAPIHLGYLALMIILGSFAWHWIDSLQKVISEGFYRPVPGQVAKVPSGLTPFYDFDPYLKGYVRKPGLPNWERSHEYLTHPSLKTPPTGVRLTLITPIGEKTIVGPPGILKDTPENVERLRRSIRSLVAYEESLQKTVETALPTVSYENAPYQQNQANYQGQPLLPGWHDVEIRNDRGIYRALLPDRRYATDISAFEKAFEQRLNHLTDSKFFATLPPANLRPGSIQITTNPPLPKGISFMLWNSRNTVWVKGTAAKSDPKKSRAAIVAAIREATDRLQYSMGTEDHLQLTMTGPANEYYNNWPLDSASGYSSGKAALRQQGELDDMTRFAQTAFFDLSPNGVVRAGPIAH